MSKKWTKFIIKLLLTVVALFLVFRNIDTQKTWGVIQNVNFFHLLLAVILFILSKILTAYRLNLYFKDIGLRISELMNLRLYAIGMFYNLFLPGGIGGDGYKVYLLHKIYKKPVRQILSAVLIDRGNGLAVLLFLVFVLFFFVEVEWAFSKHDLLINIAGLVLVPLGTYIITRIFFKTFLGSLTLTSVISLFNQLLQLACSYFILISMGIVDQFPEYLFVFLLSSTVAVLPLTIGGVGARELVFIFAHDAMDIDKNAAVAFSLLFFVITVLTSLSGIFFKFREE